MWPPHCFLVVRGQTFAFFTVTCTTTTAKHLTLHLTALQTNISEENVFRTRGNISPLRKRSKLFYKVKESFSETPGSRMRLRSIPPSHRSLLFLSSIYLPNSINTHQLDFDFFLTVRRTEKPPRRSKSHEWSKMELQLVQQLNYRTENIFDKNKKLQ